MTRISFFIGILISITFQLAYAKSTKVTVTPIVETSTTLKNSSTMEPVNPEALCDRFIKPNEKENCEKDAKSMDLDWYAATICNLVDDDDEFKQCWKRIEGKSYSPGDLASCAESDLKDTDRTLCLVRLSRKNVPNGRVPASEKTKKNLPVYQELKVKRQR